MKCPKCNSNNIEIHDECEGFCLGIASTYICKDCDFNLVTGKYKRKK